MRSAVISREASAAIALAAALVILAQPGCSGSDSKPEGEPNKEVALRYQADDGRQALLEISPFEVGRNTFRVTVLDAQSQAAAAEWVDLRLSTLEDGGEPTQLPAAATEHSESYVADYDLGQTGWWGIDVILDKTDTASFYVRLDSPSQAPLAFDAADYSSDPEAETLFRRTMEDYEGLASVKTHEELTSGFLAPTGMGVSIVTDGEVEAPDRVHYVTSSTGSNPNELYRSGKQSCRRDLNPVSLWQCEDREAQAAFDVGYLDASTAFRLGREASVDGEVSQLLLFYNPGQRAWFGWWVGEETGHLRRQAMVAPGHFMVTRYFGHNAPLNIDIPAEVKTQGG